MVKKVSALVVLLGLAWGLSGCATLTKGTTQPIAISSEPAGADCTLSRRGQSLGKVKTPGSITVKRDGDPINVTCSKDGYEEATAVMNSRVESAIYGNLLVGGVIGVMVDASSGASNHYEASLAVPLTAMSAADLASAATRPRQPPPQPVPAVSAPAPAPIPAPTAAPVTAVAAATGPASANPFDGGYQGSVDVMQTNLERPVFNTRQFDVRVAGGIGKGTVVHPLCDHPGEVALTIDPSGRVKGWANTQNTTGCTQRIARMEGHMEGGMMRISLNLKGRDGDAAMSLARVQGVSAALPVAMPSSSGPFDGEYHGGVEVSPGDLRQVSIHILGTKGTGTSKAALCPKRGNVTVTVDPSGAVSGEADLLAGSNCEARKATLTGHVEGKRLLLTANLDGGGRSQELTFNRRAAGFGVDE
jgi:hypothetical protein